MSNENDNETFLAELLHRRLMFVEATRANDFSEGISRLLSELYPDEAHFIYELLQNAEDACATKVEFCLKSDRLLVTHNGARLFSCKNVDSITSIGKSTKRDDINSIGKFGVGFKAVFSYTKTPRVFSGPFSFEIRELVCPYPIAPCSAITGETRFELPFDSNKSPTSCFEEIATGLANLPNTLLLFLKNIRSIDWTIEGGVGGSTHRHEYLNDVVEIEQRRGPDEKKDFSYWLRFTELVEAQSTFFVAVAYKLGFVNKDECIYDEEQPLSEQMKIVETDGRLYIFFPAEKEDTHLRFHLHGPYASTVARDSVPSKNTDNQALLAKTAKLVASSLSKVKELRLLTRDFLEVLPNSGDGLSEFYQPILQEIIGEMNIQPLVPVDKGGHAPANQLFNGHAAIRSVIQNAELPFFTGKPVVKWVVGVMQGQRADRLLQKLAITSWDWNDVLTAMNSRFGAGFNSENNEWLKSKDSHWLQPFYAMLIRLLRDKSPSYRYSDTISDEMIHVAKSWRIVRVTSGEHLNGTSVFFPNEDGKADSLEFPTVVGSILTGDEKGAAREATEFLNVAGVRKVGEWERIERVLQQHYKMTGLSIAWELHLEHLKRFIEWARDKGPDGTVKFTKAAKFKEWLIFMNATRDGWLKPAQAFIDAPFEQTGLKEFFGLRLPSYYQHHPLASEYGGTEDFLPFAEACGAMIRLDIKQIGAYNNPHRNELGVQWNNSSNYEVSQDYTIDDLESMLGKENHKISLLVWKTVSQCAPKQLQACYQRNSRYPMNYAKSQLVCILARLAWIPHKTGGFHRARDTRQDDLPPEFLHDNRNGWLGAIEFGAAFTQPSLPVVEPNAGTDIIGQAAETAGVPREIIEYFSNNAEAQSEFNQWREEKKKPKPPEAEPVNLTRRKKKVAEEVKDAAKKNYETRNRSVRTSAWNIRADIKINLRELNTNEDGEMICQICGDEMPFKVNGQYYFVATECICNLSKEIPQNHLALCPNCAAKYQHAKNDSDEQVKAAILATTGSEVLVRLAEMPHTILFTKTHLYDLKTALAES